MASVKVQIVSVIIILASCFLFQESTQLRAAETQGVAGLNKNGTVAVMPFFTGKYSDQIEAGRPPMQFLLDKIAAVEGERNSTGEKALTKFMYEALHKRSTLKLIPQDVVQDEFAHMSIDSTSETPLAIAVRLGKGLQADYVVVGIVWEYKDRIGSKMAAQEAASVSFSAFLVDVAAAKRIWRERYTKTQQSLSGNLLNAPEFFKQGAKWLTAEELSRLGINKILVSFPL